jgi:thiamine-monophosphate kinase
MLSTGAARVLKPLPIRLAWGVADGLHGEERLISTIRQAIRERGHTLVGIGDDACVLKDGTVISTDSYLERVHFDLAYMKLRDVGTRCAYAALSDVVAMAVRPEVLLVSLAVPPATTPTAVRSLYRGIEAACAELESEVAGGDIIASDRLMLGLTALGRTRRPRLRSGGKPGDLLYVTGAVGAAETGRLALRNGLPRNRFRRSVARHLRPVPRLAVALELRRRMRGLIDTSDGIATDCRHLARASSVRLVLVPEALPVLAETRRLCDELGMDAEEFALCAGEDYELLFTGPATIPKSVNGTTVTRIGLVETGSGVFVESSGRRRRLTLRGFDHVDHGGETC